MLYDSFLARLKELGCVFCPECGIYTWPGHPEHVTLIAPVIYDTPPEVVVDVADCAVAEAMPIVYDTAPEAVVEVAEE
jgi:hypothetical protein